jgi:hypothetical protein
LFFLAAAAFWVNLLSFYFFIFLAMTAFPVNVQLQLLFSSGGSNGRSTAMVGSGGSND